MQRVSIKKILISPTLLHRRTVNESGPKYSTFLSLEVVHWSHLRHCAHLSVRTGILNRRTTSLLRRNMNMTMLHRFQNIHFCLNTDHGADAEKRHE